MNHTSAICSKCFVCSIFSVQNLMDFLSFFTKIALKTGTNVSKTLDFHYILLNM